MTENGGNKGFSGLDGLVSDVDKGLQDASPGSQRQGPGQTRPAPPSPRAQPRPVAAKPSRPSTPPPPVNSGSGGKNVWLWILGVFVVFLVWVANQDGSSGRTTSSSSTNYSPPSTSRPQAAPSIPTLSTPPVGRNHVHSAAEIRYCITAEIRIDALRPYMNSDSQIDAFNGIVSDYNSRCGSYRYRSGALERARREIEPYRAAIVANAWDGVSLSPRTAQQKKPAVQRSQLTTDVQKALSVLGYDPGVADGIYGRKTKTAIEAFQRDYGLTVNGIESQELLRQLRRVVDQKENYRSSSDAPAKAKSQVAKVESQAASEGTNLGGQTGYVPTAAEMSSIEAVCGYEKRVNGPATFDRCVTSKRATLARQGGRPNMSGLNSFEKQSIESACGYEKRVNGPAAYYSCLSGQLTALSRQGDRPSMSGLTSSEKQAIEFACGYEKRVNGPAAYYRCLSGQLTALSRQGGRPDMSRLSSSDRQSIESACGYEQRVNGPAAYNNCLSMQIAALRQ